MHRIADGTVENIDWTMIKRPFCSGPYKVKDKFAVWKTIRYFVKLLMQNYLNYHISLQLLCWHYLKPAMSVRTSPSKNEGCMGETFISWEKKCFCFLWSSQHLWAIAKVCVKDGFGSFHCATVQVLVRFKQIPHLDEPEVWAYRKEIS